ncbi:hypothetical protein BGZ57DRAFT_984516 [Hyaloscypha finlandica]|nr:hypothetical protein BGZ57DRAFT_984516 [Hyaloscypha finlandica]
MNMANPLCVFAGCHNDPANGDDEADDDFPSIDELLAFSSKGISTVFQNSADTPQYLEGPALNTSGSRLDPSPRPDNGVGNSQGTRDRPVVLGDDESDTPKPVPEAVAVSIDAGADPASELSKKPWWDAEDECYVDDDLHPIPPLEQESLTSTPAWTSLRASINGISITFNQVSRYLIKMGTESYLWLPC